ncbi:MCE family protein [Allokutzneria albata]|uniref:Phospholipid/cholesterol/gamma-HCH transport system substrate-binding protein n=1 Tax=Allokutzneria albata TaxID=211114 RepID=A0A1G9URK7_ALLAB|nr:MlaD family protein [Allokutzneria albata]SDM62483.1 phospholipid/cholesterol/gamma-HCH transport system substrate-binding protein [Allokutzneria albata]
MKRRDPVVVGAAGLVLIVVAMLAAFFAEGVFGGTKHTAEFAESAGLEADDEVRVAGLRVGRVAAVDLAGDRVRVTFRTGGVRLGDRTVASIRIKNLLGQKYLAVEPRGEGALAEPIPRDRTYSPYDVTEAFSGLSKTVDQLDTKQLANGFRSLSEAFKDTPEEVRKALAGLSALATTISSRDAQLATLLSNTERITRTLSDRDGEIERLLKDGNLLLGEIGKRRQAIRSLLTGVRAMSKELSGVVDDNTKQLGPALQELEKLADVLQRNQNKLDKGLSLSGPFYRLIANATGNGRWVDSYVCGLVQAEKGCVPPKPAGGTR